MGFKLSKKKLQEHGREIKIKMINKHKKILNELIKEDIEGVKECIRDGGSLDDMIFWKNRIITLKEIKL